MPKKIEETVECVEKNTAKEELDAIYVEKAKEKLLIVKAVREKVVKMLDGLNTPYDERQYHAVRAIADLINSVTL